MTSEDRQAHRRTLALVFFNRAKRYQRVMAIQRRSRMCRVRSGKRISLTARDIAIFQALVRYRYLRSTYLHAFAGGASETRFKERLGDLFHEGFIDRPEKQWEFADARCMPAVYEIGVRANRVLHEAGGGVAGVTTFLASTAHRQFSHSLMICECLASIELEALATPYLRFIAWPEMLARAPESTTLVTVPYRLPLSTGFLVPDGLFGLEYQSEGKKTYRFFALEADRGTMPVARTDGTKTSYLAKLAGYQEAIARGLAKSHWGIPNLFVLTVTTSPARMADILGKFDPQSSGSLFLFKSMEGRALVAPSPRLLHEAWERPGLPSFGMNR